MSTLPLDFYFFVLTKADGSVSVSKLALCPWAAANKYKTADNRRFNI